MVCSRPQESRKGIFWGSAGKLILHMEFCCPPFYSSHVTVFALQVVKKYMKFILYLKTGKGCEYCFHPGQQPGTLYTKET